MSANSDKLKLELMGGAFVGSVNRDETTTATLGGKTYAVRPAYIAETTCKLCVSIDGTFITSKRAQPLLVIYMFGRLPAINVDGTDHHSQLKKSCFAEKNQSVLNIT